MGLIERPRETGIIEISDDKSGHISGFKFPNGVTIRELVLPPKRPDHTPLTPKAQPVSKVA